MRALVRHTSLLWVAFTALSFLFGDIAGAADGELRYADLDHCILSSRVVIRPCRIGYRLHGKLNADKSNIVLFPTWYNGQSQDQEPLIGGDGVLDSSKYLVVTLDALGDGVSPSPSNAVPTQRGVRFPKFTLRDIVEIHRRVIDSVLGVTHIHAAVGVSMGGMQAYQWALLYPDYVDRVIAIEGTPWPTSNDLLTWHLMRTAIVDDPRYEGGRYAQEPRLAFANEMDTYFAYSPAYRAAATRLEAYQKFLEETDATPGIGANNRVWQLDAMSHFNLQLDFSREQGSSGVLPRMVIVVSRQDHTVNPAPSIEWAERTHSALEVLEDNCGHMNPLCVRDQLATIVRAALDDHR